MTIVFAELTPEAAFADPLGQSLPAVLAVPQKQFAFARVGGPWAAMETGDVATCSGLIAVHAGLVFMMHVDVPWYGCSVNAALKELRERCGVESLRNVKLYDVAGFTPWMSVAATVGAALLLRGIFREWSLLVALGTLSFFLIFVGVRARVRVRLWLLGFKQPKLLTRRHASGIPLSWHDFRVNVLVPLVGPGAFEPVLSLPTQKDRDPRFLVTPKEPKAASRWTQACQIARATRAWCHWRLTRASASLQKTE